MTKFTLTDLSGRKYTFSVCNPAKGWRPVGGLYAFSDAEGWPKYVGQTESFKARNPGPSHEKWPEASRYGATRVLAMELPGGEAVREAAERDLIRAYNPPANTQHRAATQNGLAGLGIGGLRPRNRLSDL